MDLVILQDVLQRCNVLDAVMVVQITSVRLLLHLTILGVGYPIITYRFHVRPDRLTSISSVCELKSSALCLNHSRIDKVPNYLHVISHSSRPWRLRLPLLMRWAITSELLRVVVAML